VQVRGPGNPSTGAGQLLKHRRNAYLWGPFGALSAGRPWRQEGKNGEAACGRENFKGEGRGRARFQWWPRVFWAARAAAALAESYGRVTAGGLAQGRGRLSAQVPRPGNRAPYARAVRLRA